MSSVSRYDSLTRFFVASRRPGRAPYLVELRSYGSNGECQCPWFVRSLEKHLRAGLRPQDAVALGLVPTPQWGTTSDALRCFHIHCARLAFADDVLAKLAKLDPTSPG